MLDSYNSRALVHGVRHVFLVIAGLKNVRRSRMPLDVLPPGPGAWIKEFSYVDMIKPLETERYERRCVMISSNLVFSQWDQRGAKIDWRGTTRKMSKLKI